MFLFLWRRSPNLMAPHASLFDARYPWVWIVAWWVLWSTVSGVVRYFQLSQQWQLSDCITLLQRVDGNHRAHLHGSTVILRYVKQRATVDICFDSHAPTKYFSQHISQYVRGVRASPQRMYLAREDLSRYPMTYRGASMYVSRIHILFHL